MNLLSLRDRIRTKAIANSLTYTEIETLFDVNELLNQTMPCLAWRYSGETNNFDEVGTEMSLNIYLLTEFPDSVKTETADYQRDYIVTQQDALRTFFYTWLQAMPFESGSDFLEVLSTEEIPIAERLSINAFLTMEFRVNISIKRDFCVEPEEIAPTADEVKVYFNSVLKYTQACNVDLQLTLKNQDGHNIDATFTGYDIVVNQGGEDASVNNSDSSYTASVASGGTLVLPDEAITVNSAAFITKPSKKDQDILLRDVSGTAITPVSLAGNTITILDAVTIKGLMPTQTGQTTSYATNDDGDLQRGRLTDFDTIPYNNPFGGTDRFTDSVGTQVYADAIVIDWSTWNGGSSVLGYATSNNKTPSGKQVWADWMSNSPYSIGTFSNFYLANSNEMFRVMKTGTTFLNYSPFSANNPAGFWIAFSSTTTEVSSTARAISGQSNIDYPQRSTKTTNGYALLVRDFTISGTTLS
tara:strand:+ start:438 stop:1847 length:1410 start_codon:yes stop_codon:yes gene_type:complete